MGRKQGFMDSFNTMSALPETFFSNRIPDDGLYTLIVESEDTEQGTVNDVSGDYPANEEIHAQATALDGYLFTGWYNSDILVSTANPYIFFMPPNSLTLTAKFTEGYALIVQSDDIDKGTVNDISGEYPEGEQLQAQANVNEGYAFSGWYNGGELVSTDNPYNFEMPATALTLTAKFNVNLVVESQDTNKGTVNDISGNYTEGTPLEAEAFPNSSDYEFTGWYDGDDLVTTDNPYNFEMPATALTLTAKFNVNLIVESENVLMGTVVDISGNYAEGTPLEAQASANDGYTFRDWYNGVELVSINNPYNFEMPATALTLTAKFNVNLVVQSEDTNKGTVNNLSGNYPVDTPLQAEASANDGYVFDGWYNGDDLVSSDNPYNFYMRETPLTLTAKFLVVSQLTVQSEDTQKGTVNDISGQYSADTPLEAEASANDGYTFDAWYNSDDELVSSDNPYNFKMPANDYSLTGKFVNVYALTVQSEDVEKGTVNNISGNYKAGDQLQAQAIPQPLYGFEGWYNALDEPVSTDNPYNFEMPASALTLTAKFTAHE
jgi:uncharacterized repeat protein (TIGR02543 family)